MSKKNGNRSRFDRHRKTKMHQRTRIRELQLTLKQKAGENAPKSEVKS